MAMTMIAAALLAGTPAPADARCQPLLARAVKRSTPAEVPAACWRVGPVALGMTEPAVEQRLGKPVASGTVGGPLRYRVALYSFASGTNPRRIGLVELRYRGGQLAAIDTSPGARLDSDPCAGHPGRVEAGEIRVEPAAGPFGRFAGTVLGDPVSALARRFGRAPAGNRSRDWLTYLPVPIAFDADPDRGRITGIAIATDDRALTAGALPRLRIRRDGATCRLLSIRYGVGGA